MIRHVAGLAAAGALTAEALLGCSSGASVDVKPPDGTVQQIEAATGWGNTLDGLPLTQYFDWTVPGSDGEVADVFNFTRSKVNPDTIKKLAALDVQMAAPASTTYPADWRFPIEYLKNDGTQKKVNITASLSVNAAKVHDFMLVPEGTAVPSTANGSGTQTIYLPGNGPGQNISVIEQPENSSGDPESFVTGDAGLTTEMAQSFVYVLAMEPDPLALSKETARITQETFANSAGAGQRAILAKQDYSTYAADEKYAHGKVPVEYSDNPDMVGDNYTILDFTFTKGVFTAMRRTLLRK